MALTEPHAPGATPLTAEQLSGLRLPITTHGELNAAEQQNILRVRLWARRARSITVPGMLSRECIERWHRRMYGDYGVGRGANARWTPTSAVRIPAIGVELRVLFDDARYWIEHATYQPSECAVRLHHRGVLIHPFANGNGRLRRFYADLLLTHHFERAPLPWGGGSFRYVSGLKRSNGQSSGPRRANVPGCAEPTGCCDFTPDFA